MQRSSRDSRWRGAVAALAGLCALLSLAPGFAAKAPTANIEVHAKGKQLLNFHDGTYQLEQDVELRQAPDTLLRADKAEGSNLAKGYDDGHWILTGKVHIEFNGAVLDADRAVVVFADGGIFSIEVRGKPATFSRPTKTAGQRSQGHASTITYDATKRQMRFTGHIVYSFGPYEGTADKPLDYNLDSSELFSEKSTDDDSRINFTFRNMQAGARMWRSNTNAGTQLLEQGVELRQAPDSLVRADKAEGSNLTDGYDNGRWVVTGKVHIEFNGAVLDADSANVVFADSRIQSIQVQGMPALFSHPAKAAGKRNQGRAENIAFDGTTRQVRLTGHSWYSFPPYEGNTELPLDYNLDSTDFHTEKTADKRIEFILRADEKDQHVPAPRTPPRSKAQ